MRCRIEFTDGTTEPERYVSDCGVNDGVLWVRPHGPGSDVVERYPLANVKKWTTDR